MATKRKAGTAGKTASARTAATKRHETDDVSDFIRAVECLPVMVNRRNVGAIKRGKRYVKFGVKGEADVQGLYKGLMWAVEFKLPGERQSEEQAAWEKLFRSHGGLFKLAFGVVEAMDFVVMEVMRRKAV